MTSWNGKILKEKWILPAGSEIESVQVIARGSNIKNIQKLINENQFPDGSFSPPDDWQKIKGYALIYSPDRKRKLYTEIHFYYCKKKGIWDSRRKLITEAVSKVCQDF